MQRKIKIETEKEKRVSAKNKAGYTELVFILDRSGSMAGLETDTIGGYNNLLKEQRSGSGEVKVTTVLFDDKYELLHQSESINSVKPITKKEYFARGSTALLDAVGRTIVDKRTAVDLAETKPKKVLFVIITDGFENASREYNIIKVKELIEAQKKCGNWEFMFLGANIDAVATAKTYGIDENCAVCYECDSQGLKTSYKAMSKAIRCYAEEGKIKESWQEEIMADYENRKK
ncbi:MAG: VWA domain-containing protein [Christensenellaceae bacterium]|jgi:hypothetical protein|nr:VWA domain-containing protein [Christensenellaceae bacterium]